MMRLYDPVPRIESREPFKTGIAQVTGSHGDLITVLWDGASVTMTVRGKEIASGNAVNAVCIDGAWFAILETGGYDSNEPKKLATWARSARASLAMRKILDKNPRWRKYYRRKVNAFSEESHTASLSDGSTLHVKFGSEDAAVVVGEMGLVSNQIPVHVVGYPPDEEPFNNFFEVRIVDTYQVFDNSTELQTVIEWVFMGSSTTNTGSRPALPYTADRTIDGAFLWQYSRNTFEGISKSINPFQPDETVSAPSLFGVPTTDPEEAGVGAICIDEIGYGITMGVPSYVP